MKTIMNNIIIGHWRSNEVYAGIHGK